MVVWHSGSTRIWFTASSSIFGCLFCEFNGISVSLIKIRVSALEMRTSCLLFFFFFLKRRASARWSSARRPRDRWIGRQINTKSIKDKWMNGFFPCFYFCSPRSKDNSWSTWSVSVGKQPSFGFYVLGWFRVGFSFFLHFVWVNTVPCTELSVLDLPFSFTRRSLGALPVPVTGNGRPKKVKNVHPCQLSMLTEWKTNVNEEVAYRTDTMKSFNTSLRVCIVWAHLNLKSRQLLSGFWADEHGNWIWMRIRESFFFVCGNSLWIREYRTNASFSILEWNLFRITLTICVD